MSNHPFSSEAPSLLARQLSEPTLEVVVVDVQPALAHMHGRDYAREVGDLLSGCARALIFYVSDSEYHDTREQVLSFYRSVSPAFAAAEPTVGPNLLWIPKDRDWFSPWFDGPRYADIVPVCRRMLEAGVTDSRHLGEVDQFGRSIRMPPPQVLAALRRFPAADLVGGSRGECLDEVELVAQVLGITLRVLDEYVWVRGS